MIDCSSPTEFYTMASNVSQAVVRCCASVTIMQKTLAWTCFGYIVNNSEGQHYQPLSKTRLPA